MFRDFFGDAQATGVASGTVGAINAGEFEQRVLDRFGFGFRDGRGNIEEISAAGEIILFCAAGEESGMTNPFKRGWDGMREEAVNKFIGGKRHDFFLVVIAAVAVGEGDVAVGDLEDAVVSDGDAVGVAAEVIEDDLGAGESGFGIDDPILFVERTEERMKRVRVGKGDASFGVSGFQVVEEFAAEHKRERFDGKEKSGWRRDPGRSIKRQRAAGDGAVQMDMRVEFLIPGVEDAGNPEFTAEGVVGKAEQGFGDRAEKDIEDDFFIAEGQGVEFVGQREDGMEIRDGQKFGLARGQPLRFGERLAFGAMAVSAGVVRVARKATGVALLDMTAQRGGAAGLNSPHDFKMRGRQTGVPAIRFAVEAKDIGQFPEWPSARHPANVGHRCRLGQRIGRGARWRRVGQKLEWTFGGQQFMTAQLQVARGGLNIFVAHQDLDGAQIFAGFQEVRRKTVAQGMDAAALADPGFAFGVPVNFFETTFGQGFLQTTTREEPDGRPVHFPVFAQLGQERLGQERVAVFVSFALFDADHHALAVDVGDFETNNFAETQSGVIRGHQQGAVFGILSGRKEVLDFLNAQDFGQSLGVSARRQTEFSLGAAERGAVEEFQTRGDEVTSAPGEFALVQQVQEIIQNPFFLDLIGGLFIVFGQPSDRPEIGLLGPVGQPPELHVANHPLSQCRHNASCEMSRNPLDVGVEDQRSEGGIIIGLENDNTVAGTPFTSEKIRTLKRVDLAARRIRAAGYREAVSFNISEAQSAQSRADYLSKFEIALKEARETGFRLAHLKKVAPPQTLELPEWLTQECYELTAILVASVKTLKANGVGRTGRSEIRNQR